MPRSEKQFETMRDRSRRKILDSAVKLFAIRGYHTTTVDDIATEAEISKGLIYNYFSSKENLLSEVVNEGLSAIESLSITGVTMTPDERLFKEIESVFKSLEGDFEYWKFFSQILFQPEISKLYKKELLRVLNQQIDGLTAIFEEMGQADARMNALAIGAIFDGIGFHRTINPDYPLEAMKKFIIQKYCHKDKTL